MLPIIAGPIEAAIAPAIRVGIAGRRLIAGLHSIPVPYCDMFEGQLRHLELHVIDGDGGGAKDFPDDGDTCISLIEDGRIVTWPLP